MVAMSLRFYAAQRSGVLPADNPVPWRGNSALGDFAPNGASLVGGYFDDGGACRALEKHLHAPLEDFFQQVAPVSLYRPMPQKSVFVPQRVKPCWIISCFTCNRHHAAICSKEYSCLLGGTKLCGPARMKHRL